METSSVARATSILLFGSITMLFAEVFSGSSVYWFLKPSSLFITYPFYILHAVFFFNLAIRLNKTSLRALYIIGTIYGAYEFWFTTVPLYGYINKTPVFHVIFGIALFEYFALIYFWHPVFSFIFSLATYDYLCLKQQQEPSRSSLFHALLVRTRKNEITWLLAFTFATLILLLYTSFKLDAFFIGYGGTLLIIMFFYFLRKKQRGKISISDLAVNNTVFSILGGLIIALYIAGFYYHSHFDIVEPSAFLVAILTYSLSFFLLRKAPTNSNPSPSSLDPQEKNRLIPLFSYLVYPLPLAVLFVLLGFVFAKIAIIAFFSLMFLGLILLLYIAYSLFIN